MSGGVAFPHGSSHPPQGTPPCPANGPARVTHQHPLGRNNTGHNNMGHNSRRISRPAVPGRTRPRCISPGSQAGRRSRRRGADPTHRRLDGRMAHPGNPARIKARRRDRRKARPITRARPGNPMGRKDNRRTTGACRRPASRRCSALARRVRRVAPVHGHRTGSPRATFTGARLDSGPRSRPGHIRPRVGRRDAHRAPQASNRMDLSSTQGHARRVSFMDSRVGLRPARLTPVLLVRLVRLMPAGRRDHTLAGRVDHMPAGRADRARHTPAAPRPVGRVGRRRLGRAGRRAVLFKAGQVPPRASFTKAGRLLRALSARRP